MGTSVGQNDGPVFAAEWDTATVNDLPDSAFLYVESGGEKDADGKTTPRSKRHFPYRDGSGKVDLPHLRNAIARIPQSDAPGLDKAAVQKRAQKLLKKANKKAVMASSERAGLLAWLRGIFDRALNAEAGDTANIVENEFLPKIGEHWARVAEPETFNHVSFRAVDEPGQPGIRRIEGQLKDGDGSYTAAAYHFDKRVFPAIGDVQRWLSARKINATKLEPAKDVQYPKMTCGADLEFLAEAEIATEGDGPRSVRILAYTGGPLRVKGYDQPVVVDLPTLELRADQTPIVLDHDETLRAGHASASHNGRELRLGGLISPAEQAGRDVLASTKDGFKYRASIGCKMTEAIFDYYGPGETLSANGQQFTGPLYYARGAKLAHVALVTNGADENTQVQIAAENAEAAFKAVPQSAATQGTDTMPQRVIPNLNAAADPSAVVEKKTGDAYEASAKAERSGEKEDHLAAAESQHAAAAAHRDAEASSTNDHERAFHHDQADAHDRLEARHKLKASGHPSSAYCSGLTDLNAATQGATAMGTSPEVAALRKELAGELTRQKDIRAAAAEARQTWCGHAPADMLAKIDKIELEASTSDADIRDVQLKLLRECRPSGPIGGAPFAIHSHGNGALTGAVLEAAAAQALTVQLPVTAAPSGRAPNLEKHYNPEVLQAAHDRFRGRISLQELILEAAWANGCDKRFIRGPGELRDILHHVGKSSPDLEAADMSTISLPDIFSNLMNKVLLEYFWAVESVWRDVAMVGTAKDFKPHYNMRFYGNFAFEALGAAGEIKHGTVGDIKYQNQVDLRAKMFVTSYKDIINDDLGALQTVPRLIGMGAAYDLNTNFWTTWLAGVDSQGNNMWTTARKNLLSASNMANYTAPSTGAALAGVGLNALYGVDTLSVMKQLFLEQKKPDGAPVAIAPAVLLAAPMQSDYAKRLVQSSELRSTVSGATYAVDNPHAGLFKLAISSYLASAFGISGADDTASWLLGDPAIVPTAEVLFLNGQQTPTVQSSDADFDTLGFQHRGWWAWGIALQEYRASVKAKAGTGTTG